MQINRLFEMVYLLMDRKKMTAKELSDHFEISQRTIYRDIEVLNASGIPISANKGKGGGIELLDSFVLDKSAFSKKEQNEIAFALQSFRSLKAVNTDNVLKKLSAIFQKDAMNWIDVDFADWAFDGKEKFDLVKSAIVDKRCLSFDYFGTNGEKTHRTVYPMQLWFKHRAWYIKAFCLMRREYRLFKLSRAKNMSAAPAESNFEMADLFELELFSPNTRNKSGEFYYEEPDGGAVYEHKAKSSKNNVALKLLVDSSLAHKVFDEFEEKEITTDEGGNFIISAIFPEDEWLYGYVLSFCQHAKVIEPLYFRDKIIDRLQKTLARYQ
ncbi:MAG: YafY family transcriptional regulator [Oscillospiraceae bacterium]|nr:YafY family transcriptional regulator [Oscillospiraceae bacterium]